MCPDAYKGEFMLNHTGAASRRASLYRWIAPVVMVLGLFVSTPALAASHHDGHGGSSKHDGHQGGKKDGQGSSHPSVPETPYALVFPAVVVGAAVWVYRKRRSQAE